MRAGIGFDIHPLVFGRDCILGCVKLEFGKGPKGHSDGDALSHAVIDAVLGAAALGDIGHHFPDDDPAYQDISSAILLERTAKILKNAGYNISSIDATLILEQPKVGPVKREMAAAVAKALGIPSYRVNVKAKTHEGLGEIGRSEAVAAQAVAMVEEIDL